MASQFRTASDLAPARDMTPPRHFDGERTAANGDRKRKSSSDSDPVKKARTSQWKPQRQTRGSSRSVSRSDAHSPPPSPSPALAPAPAPAPGPAPAPSTQREPRLPETHTPHSCSFPRSTRPSSLSMSGHAPLHPAGQASDHDNTVVDAQRAMTTRWDQPCSFFHFPPEVRNIIYDYSLRWPDSRGLYRPYYRKMAAWDAAPGPIPPDQKWLLTPTILLLCKDVTNECLPMLKARWLVIDRIPPCRPSIPGVTGGGFMKISDFIGPRTLQAVQYIDIRIGLGEGPLGSGWVWERVLNEILGVLGERNSFAKLRLLVRVCNHGDYPVWDRDNRSWERINKKIHDFIGANPNVFAPREVIIEMWRIEGHSATFWDADVWPDPKDESTFEPKERVYPDQEMFPGSILQFVEELPASIW